MLHRRHRPKVYPEHHASLPYGVRIFAWVRAVRWIGWGLGEALIPVFILMFSNTFAEAGLFSSTVDIVSLVNLPIIGLWADRFSAKKLILWSMALYPFVGVSYFFAGLFRMAIFIVLARVINGFNWELENVGIETYYRRVTDRKRIATSFGYIETWSHVAWISAALVGMVLVIFVPIYYLLFAIAPFAIISYFIALKAPEDEIKKETKDSAEKTIEKKFTPVFSLLNPYGKTLRAMRTWNMRFWLLGTLIFFSSIVSSLVYFFIPIDAYLAGANLSMVVLITIFGALPALFAYQLGKITDSRNRYVLILFGLVIIAVIVLGIATFPYYWFKLLAMFLMGIILELFYVIQSSLITTLGPAETYGERGSSFEGVVTLGDLCAPLIIGIGLDVLGFPHALTVIAGLSLLLAFWFLFLRNER